MEHDYESNNNNNNDLLFDTAARFYRHIEELMYKADIEGNSDSPLLRTIPVPTPKLPREPTTNAPSPTPSAVPTTVPSSAPTRTFQPSQNPTTTPSQSPTDFPTRSPSEPPTSYPTRSPSESPTMSPTASPTNYPTVTPTVNPFPPNTTPLRPPPWYFNYDATSDYGPGEMGLYWEDGSVVPNVGIVHNQWGKVARNPFQDDWMEFTNYGWGPWKGVLDIHQPSTTNICANGKLQSPIDLRPSNGGACQEHHEVRSRRGDFQVTGRRVQKRIDGNKLRLVYERRPCADLRDTKCQEPDPPHADFPYGWGGFADVTHIDFKTPSEHTILDERYDAEMQIYHLHPGRRRFVVQAVLIRATITGYNDHFQEALHAFQKEYDSNRRRCRRRMKEEEQSEHIDKDRHPISGRNLTSASPLLGDFLTWAKYNTGMDYEHWKEINSKRDAFQSGPWDPYHEMLIPTIHFWRYDGSVTEPPCGEFVTWFVADAPMLIGEQQLHQLRTILFTNVDPDTCQPTSLHSEQSVARPTQPHNGRAVWRCTKDDFGPDDP